MKGFDEVPGGFVDHADDEPAELPPLEIPPGQFEAFIGASDDQAGGGASACDYEIRRIRSDYVFKESLSGRLRKSDEQKGYLCALLAVAERIPPGSSVTICCPAEWIVNAIKTDLARWYWAGELDRLNPKRKYAKIWLRILKKREGLRKLSARMPGKDDRAAIKLSQERARAARPLRRQGN